MAGDLILKARDPWSKPSMLARRLANSLAQSQHRGGEAACCCWRFDPCSLSFERNSCNQDGMFRRRGHFQQTFESGLPQSRQIHFQTIHDNATCVHMHILYIYMMKEMRRSILSGFRFMMEEVQSKIQETLPGPLLLGRLAPPILFPVFVLRVSWAFPSSQDIAGFRRLISCVCVAIVGVSWFIFMAQYGNYGYGYAL